MSEVNNEDIGLFGQAGHEPLVEMMSLFGWVPTGESLGPIVDHADRAVSLLIEQFRRPYRVATP